MRQLKSSKLSLARQARQYLLDLIQDGTYQPGEQIPSEETLASQLGISRPTLREALRDLEHEGIVIRKHGVGTFVAPGYRHRLDSGLERLQSILELAAQQGLQIRFDDLQVRQKPADPELIDKLQILPDTPLTHVHRVMLVDNVPVAYMADAVLSSILSPADVNETFNGSVLDLLKQKQDQPISQAIADIIPLNAGAELSRKLKVEPGHSLLLLEEILFNEQGIAVEFSRNYFVSDFFRFHIVRR